MTMQVPFLVLMMTAANPELYISSYSNVDHQYHVVRKDGVCNYRVPGWDFILTTETGGGSINLFGFQLPKSIKCYNKPKISINLWRVLGAH